MRFLFVGLFESSFLSKQELKVAVEGSVRDIPLETCKVVIANFAKRVERCLTVNGMHFEHMKF